MSSIASSKPAESPSLERERQMREYKVSYDGCAYEFNGYRYDRLDDALAYARLMRSRPQQLDPHGTHRVRCELGAESETDLRRMASLGILLENGRFCFEEFRYDRLADAVNYATLLQRRRDEGGRTAAGND
ncbi:MAG: hypothetical protein J0H86_01850 [Xanthomonadaceae bacterium]|nr:hypothetical protein [Xanthomonadaceae bacterium]ODU32083.1 MAG: hypothetical protein ABS97_17770 [Xanthomonadaceae bacterium SCN 69-320]ODV18944.1 MAG: hypothetical protein ABT27_11915 [Xanthomonadaceae bacterium SCN 69-25]